MPTVEPAYGVRSLSDVLPAIATAVGHPLAERGTALQVPDASAYVMLLIDGLGADLLARYAHSAPYLSSLLARGTVGTAGVPSTTATSLTSLGTGLPPGTHGMVGFTSRIPGSDRLIQALQWDKSVDPLEWQPNQTVLEMLERSGVNVTVVNKRDFATSGLTVASARGGRFVGADRVGERIAAAVKSMAVERPAVTYLYDSDLDSTGHQHGVASQEWLQQLSVIDDEAEQLREALPSDVRLLVVADHGMVDSVGEKRIDIDDHSYLRNGVRLIGGEARFRHLYCQRGAVDDVVAMWQEFLGERAIVLDRAGLAKVGWMGDLDPFISPRIGDVVVACLDDYALFSSRDFSYETQLIGVHGSVTAAEMNIPILVD